MKHINLGCGHAKMINALNVDAFGDPDFKWNLNETPYPWDDSEFDKVTAFHVMEHLENWWGAFLECVRITKTGGTIEVRVPHASSDTALTYRDHIHVIDLRSFDGVAGGPTRTTNAWYEEQDKVPVDLESYFLVPFEQYQWMPSWLLAFVASHMRNFIWEQRMLFRVVK